MSRPSANAAGKRAESPREPSMRERRGFNYTLPPHYRLQRNPSTGHTRMVPADDYYVAAMFEDQARAFMTEGDNRIRADRLPNVYRRALLPSPGPGHRPDIPFMRVDVEEVEAADDAPQAEIVGRYVRRVVDRFMSWAAQLLRHAHEEECRRLRANSTQIASEEAASEEEDGLLAPPRPTP